MKSWGMAGVLLLTGLSACTGATTPGDQISFVEDQDGSVTDPNNLITGGDAITAPDVAEEVQADSSPDATPDEDPEETASEEVAEEVTGEEVTEEDGEVSEPEVEEPDVEEPEVEEVMETY